MKKKIPEQRCLGYHHWLLTLVFSMVFGVAAQAQTVLQSKVTISFHEQSLDKALQQLQKSTGINFAYTQDDVQSFKVPRMSFTNEPLENVCKQLFKNTALSFKEFSGYIVITRPVPAAPAVKKPTGVFITGIITDAETKEALPGVNILVQRTMKGVMSKEDGSFVIEAQPGDNLLFTYTGYESVREPVGARTNFAIALKRTGAMGEVVVLGFGQTQKKIAQTGAIASLSTKEIKQSPAANIANALTGRLPGLISVQRSGEPGADNPEMYIRGRATFNSTAPLLTIDGVEKDPNLVDLSVLDPNEVESITILKDASATALYGVKGANGVIIVKTRRGTAGKPRINTSVQSSVQSATRIPKYLDSYHFALLANEAYKNDNPNGTLLPYSEEALEAYASGSDPYKYPNVDWMHEMLKPAQMTRANFNISGGSPMVKYFVNAGYTQQNGLYKAAKNDQYDANLKYRRYNFRSNIDIDFDRDFSVGLSLFGAIEDQNTPNINTDVIFNYLGKTPPNAYPIQYPNGFYGGTTRGNPFALVNTTGYRQYFNSSLSGMFTAIRKLDFVTPGLFVKGNFSFDGYSRAAFIRSKEMRTALYKGSGDYYDTSSYSFSGADAPLKAPESEFTQNRSTWLDLSVNYERSFGKHNITALLLANRQQQVIGGTIPYVTQGLVARVTWNLNNKYFGELNAGYNGTDNFAKDRRYGFFPAVSAGWVISKEAFLQNNAVLDFLKLRASYGLTGNHQLGNRRWLFISEYVSGPGYSFGTDQLTAIPGRQEGAMSNPDVTWEKARKLNIGLEARLWNSLLNLTVDVFREKRNDILITRGIIPDLLGVSPGNLTPANMGVIVNRGIDLELTHNNRIGNVMYSLRANGSFARNKVLFRDEISYPYDYLRTTGHPIGQEFGFTAIGFFNSKEEIANSPRQFGNLIPGDLKYKDLNEDNVIDNNDKGPIGKSTVPEFLHGFSGSVSWKNFDVSVLFQGAGNYTVRFSHEGAWEFYNGAKVMEQHLGRWTPETAATASYPALHYGQNTNNHQENSSFFLKDATYLRLKNIEIGYTFKKLQIGRFTGISSLRLYANGMNLYTWDRMGNGSFDPEAPSGKGFFYPQLRVVNFGVSADF
ncbi:TonB-dependent receptor [Longitalea arenae]|uniref:TonB-dependent receptor n=1 Tax=Longitalea arenae TaxID=2812558 RepID=UPI00196704AC|nr:TonB-dependent receptor [Longitalea arenae]